MNARTLGSWGWRGAVLAAAGLALAACGAGGAPAAATAPASSPSTVDSPQATVAAPSPSAPAPSAPAHAAATTHGYADAKVEWKKGAVAISAQQGQYWMAAAQDLKGGEGTDPGSTAGYPKAIAELTELASLPDAQQTPAQNAAYHQDITALDTFFATPGLYS